MLNRVTVLLNGDLSPIFGAGDVQAPAVTTGEVGQPAVGTAPQAEQGGFPWMMIAIWVAVIAVFYFMTIRPQRKRAKDMQEMQAGIRVGDKIVTNSGMFGRIAEVGEDCFMVEFGTNRSIFIPIRKSDVQGVQEPKMTPVPKT